jgi:predicted RNA-binding Zn-ribbon protein involved in translation (DUF1610 family)
VKSSSLRIQYQCPQCGAPATLEETDHLFSCDFCRVKSYLLSSVYRYVLPNTAPPNKDLLYLPYWRCKGMLFFCASNEIKYKIVDVSNQGISSPFFPPSLGLRSQTLELRFLTPETEGRFLKPGHNREDMERIIDERFGGAMPMPIHNRSFIGEVFSIIFAPFYVDDKVIDAVLNRPVSPALPEDFDVDSLEGGPADWRIRFIPALCPDCGWDLEGERASLALYCKNCKSIWQPAKSRFIKLKFGYMPQEGESITYLPFWRIKADISGIDLNTYADLVKLANLPRVVQEGWEEQAFRFWIPAFKVRPQDFLRFGNTLTLSQPQVDWEPTLPKQPLHPVTLSVQEAVEGLKLIFASFIKPRGIMFPKLPEIEIKGKSFFLAYIPFRKKGNELSQPAFRLRINKNLLTYALHL